MKLLYWNISELNKNLWKLNTTWNTLQWILLVWRYRWQKAAITRLTTKKGVGGPTLSQPLIQLNCDISQLINGTRARWSVSFISWSRLFFSQWSCQSHHHCSARVCVYVRWRSASMICVYVCVYGWITPQSTSHVLTTRIYVKSLNVLDVWLLSYFTNKGSDFKYLL